MFKNIHKYSRDPQEISTIDREIYLRMKRKGLIGPNWSSLELSNIELLDLEEVYKKLYKKYPEVEKWVELQKQQIKQLKREINKQKTNKLTK